jgi:hypothetical protein
MDKIDLVIFIDKWMKIITDDDLDHLFLRFDKKFKPI